MHRLTLLTLAALVFCSGCASGPAAPDWSALVVEARPDLSLGPCGPQAAWTKTIAVYDDAEIVGVLTVRPKCKEAPNE